MSPPATVTSDGMRHPSALCRKSGGTTGQSIGCFLDKFENYGKWNFDAQLARLEKEAQNERAWHKRRMAKIETRRREVLCNMRNSGRLSSFVAQLKEVQDAMMDGSDEEVASQIEAVATSVKSEKDS